MKAKKENFTAKLNRLFKDKRKPDGTSYTQTEVVEASNGVLTRVYLWKLRSGRASNPGLIIIQFISGFFGVDPSYFFDGEEMKAALARVSPERGDRFVDQIALRSPKLDDNDKQAVLYMIESILKAKEKSQL